MQQQFAQRLQELISASGLSRAEFGRQAAAVERRMSHAPKRPLSFSPQRISDWLSGKNVPSERAVAAMVLTVRRARRQDSRSEVAVRPGLLSLDRWAEWRRQARNASAAAAGDSAGTAQRRRAVGVSVGDSGAGSPSFGGSGSPRAVSPPAMAPVLPDRFVPRPQESEQLLAALRQGKGAVVLHGPGGFGKTTLASWACAVPGIRESFPDGVLWAEVGREPGADRVARCLSDMAALLSGWPSPGPFADVPAAAQALRSALAGRRVLLVVDNVWSAADLRPFQGLGDEVQLLVTTRRTGLLEAVSIHVGDMSVAQAIAVLGVEDTADSASLRPLLDRVGCWPLALAMLSGVLRSLVQQHGKDVREAVRALAHELEEYGVLALDDLSDADVVTGVARTLELSLADLVAVGGRGCEERFVSLAAFPAGETIPFRLLHRLWDVSDLRARAEGDRFAGRSLCTVVGGEGLRLHDVTRQAVRILKTDQIPEFSRQLLGRMRPSQGWHRLPRADMPLTDSLAFHLLQAGLAQELGNTLRDIRFLAQRLALSGPTALDGDLARYTAAVPGDTAAAALAGLVRREAPVFTGPLSAHDLALTLETRCLGVHPLAQWLSHTGQAREGGGLRSLHPPVDRDHPALERSVAAAGLGEFRDADWHPNGRFLAVAGHTPSVEIIDTRHTGAREWAVEGDVIFSRVRWSPDGTRLALVGVSDRFAEPHDSAGTPHGVHRVHRNDVIVYDLRAGREILAVPVPATLALFRQLPPALCWSPDSRRVAVASDTDVRLYDLASDGEPMPLAGSEDACAESEVSLTWHPVHGLIAHSSRHTADGQDVGVLRRWADPALARQEPQQWQSPLLWGRGRSLIWRPHGRTLVLDLEERAVAIVDPFTQRVLWRMEHARDATAHWSPDGKQLAVREAPVWPRRGGAQITFWSVPPDHVLSPDHPPVPTASLPLGPYHHDQDCVSWQPDSTRLVTTSDRRLLQFWNTEHLVPTTAAAPAATAFLHVRWSPDARSVAVAGENGRWMSVQLEESCVTPHGGYPFPGHDPATRHRWPAEVGVPAQRRPRGGPPVVVHFAPDEQHHLIGLPSEPLQVFTAAGALVTELVSPADAQRWRDACFTPRGDRIVAVARTSDWDHVYSVWNLTEAAQRQEAAARSTYQTARPAAHHPNVWRVTASDTHAVMLAHPNYIGLFRLSDMHTICWIKTNSQVYDAAFDPSGHHLAVVGDTALHLFEVHTPANATADEADSDETAMTS
ncbi:NB-ARC domain-containing protein [Streptomyces sp. CC219B]|uniref:NB-ARC domain-containing protein n=1 Tax=Streptomyces sp. CC219B TaxID=3044574 RepID=UPI0024A8E931|nr:NB-ARC domain-containing protein [Streptomyces sp. CC219B]